MNARFDPNDLGGRDAAFIQRCLPLLEKLDRRYFRLDAAGQEHLPEGPALLVANHNGGIFGPDLLCTLPVLWRALGAGGPLYALAHDFAMVQFTALGRILQKWGALRASRANAARVLEAGGKVLVYPGGDLDAYRHFSRRHEVVIAPRTGFVELARKLRVPIVPIVVRGAHQSAIIVSEGAAIARALGMQRWARVQRFPIALALPWGIAFGPWTPYLPLPFPLRLRILPPVTVDRNQPALEVSELVQAMMTRALSELAS